MLYRSEIDRTFVYVFVEIQNPQQMLQIQFSLSRGISAEEPTDKHALQISMIAHLCAEAAPLVALNCGQEGEGGGKAKRERGWKGGRREDGRRA